MMLEEKIERLTASIDRLCELMSKEGVKPDEAPEDIKITFEEMRNYLGDLSQKHGKSNEVRDLIKSFGVNKLSEIDEKDYPEVMEKAGGL